MERRIPIRTGAMGSLKVPCRFYAHGKCTKGARCPYLHDEEPKVRATSTTSSHLPLITTSKATSPCLFFARGTCKRGADCMYSHENDSVTAPPSTAHHSEGSGQRDHVPSDSRSQVQCSFFAKGKCLKGDKCAFAHSGDAGAVGAEVSTSEVRSHSSFHLLCWHGHRTSPELTCDIYRSQS